MAYETILLVHISSFIWNISLVVLADGVGLLWVIGKIQRLPKLFMFWTHRLIWVGFTASIASGAYLFWDLRDYLLETPAFLTKMGFVLALFINSFFISKHLKRALEAESFAHLERPEKIKFFISGAVSSVSWVAVFVSAQFLGL